MPFEFVDAVLEETGCAQRRLRDLPSRAVVYFLLAMCLFPEVGYRLVWNKLTAALAGVGLEVAWPTAKALRDLRRRIGPAPVRRPCEVLTGPPAQLATTGVRFGRFHGLVRGLQLDQAGRHRAQRGVVRAGRPGRLPDAGADDVGGDWHRALIGAVFGPTDAVTACSSRSATLGAGTCGLKPSRCISLEAPETRRRRGTSCRVAWPPSTRSTPCPPPSRGQPDPHRGTRPVSPDSAGTADNGIRSGRGKPEPSRPPSRHNWCQWSADFTLTGSRRATSGGLISCSNHSAACIRTDSRRRRPAEVSPRPPSAYLTLHGRSRPSAPIRGFTKIHPDEPKSVKVAVTCWLPSRCTGSQHTVFSATYWSLPLLRWLAAASLVEAVRSPVERGGRRPLLLLGG